MGRKRLKSKLIKYCQNNLKFQIILEVLKWHENNSEGHIRGENDIHKLIFPFFILNGRHNFYSKVLANDPHSTRNYM